MPQPLARSFLAGGHAHQQIEYLAPYLNNRSVSVGNASGIDVHVVAHAAVDGAVTRDLDHRNGGKTDGAASPSGKGNHIDAARGESCKRHRIVAGRVHEYEAWRGDSFRIIDYVHQWRGAGLRHRPQ